jgi:hypothetical protein
VAGDIAVQTERVMENLKAMLGAAGLDFSHVARCTVFLTDMADFAKMNEVYGRYFTGTPPARTTVRLQPADQRCQGGDRRDRSTLSSEGAVWGRGPQRHGRCPGALKARLWLAPAPCIRPACGGC